LWRRAIQEIPLAYGTVFLSNSSIAAVTAFFHSRMGLQTEEREDDLREEIAENRSGTGD
jgi:hypothetical protein